MLIAGWLSEQQQRAIEYLREENRVLREQLGGKRILPSDDQRRRLATKGELLGRKLLGEVCTIVTPDTILRWHRKLIAQKYDGSHSRRTGRPGIMREIRQLILCFATENRSWGYERIEGELRKVGQRVALATIANVLKEHGLESAPTRSKHKTWAEFLRTHWGSIAAMDFFTIEAWTTKGLTRFHVLFVIDLATRRVEIVGISDQPYGEWVCNVLRRQLGGFDGFLRNHQYLIHDRDPLFTHAMIDMLGVCGVQSVKLPPKSPNLNAYAERFVRSIKSECLDRVIPIGERHLQHTIDAYIEHYNRERPHQGLGNELLSPNPSSTTADGEVVCDEQLGGLIRSYRRAA